MWVLYCIYFMHIKTLNLKFVPKHTLLHLGTSKKNWLLTYFIEPMWHSLLLGGPHARPFKSKTLFASVILSPLAWKFIGYLGEYSLFSHRGGSHDEWGEAHLYVRGREYILEGIEIRCNSFCYCTMQLTKMCERGKKKKG